MSELEGIIEIIKTVRDRITDDSDTGWSSKYDNIKAFQDDLDRDLNELLNGNVGILSTFNTHFAPTSSFQEHSMANGWSEEYIQLSDKFDLLYDSIKKKSSKIENKPIPKLSLWKRFMKFLDKSEVKLSKEEYFKKWEISELLEDLHLASEMLSQREGGYSGEYLSVEEFKLALDEAIDDIEGGNKIDLSFFYYCFAPTCEWDDFTNENGTELGNRIFERVSKWKKWWDSNLNKND